MSIHDTNFQKWIMSHIPEDKMLYKKGFENYIVLWRDKIITMFYPVWGSDIDEVDAINKQNENVEVVGTHWSKSIEHPCVRIRYKGIDIVFRYNFYDYEIAVVGDIELDLPMKGLFASKSIGDPDDKYFGFFYQGFPGEYIIKNYYEDNKAIFMASIPDHYRFHTFMYILKNEIDKKRG